jgi:AraC family transcriptional regulator
MLDQRIIGSIAVNSSARMSGCDCPKEVMREQQKYRVLQDDAAPDDGIAMSRWVDKQATSRYEEVVTAGNQCIVGVALRPAFLAIAREGRTIFDGRMPTGAVHLTTPRSVISMHFRSPFDFLRVHVHAHAFGTLRNSLSVVNRDLDDMIVMRDAFAEKIARLLKDHRTEQDDAVSLCIGRALVAHVARLGASRRLAANALPKWRLRRVEEYVRANYHRGLGLAELANAAGLSRMHFAAQFRVATGYRPHEYLLQQRIETAKSLLTETNMALAEIAMSVGFSTQAHFSTVFKRMTDRTPARWRSGNKPELTTNREEFQTSEPSDAWSLSDDCSM